MTIEAVKNIFKYHTKIKSAQQLVNILPPRPRKKKVIMCHGVFDIVHPGHLRHLIYAKSKGDILVVSLTADKHIVKGNIRPHIPEQLRSINLAALEIVDFVIIDQDETPLNNLKLLQPDYYVKGYEYIDSGPHPKTVEEMKVLEEYGGETIFSPGDVVYSSSHFIDLAPPKIGEDKLIILMDSEKITFDDLRNTVNSFSKTTIHVVGDTIVDSYTECSMIGGMTKTPTMSLRIEKKQDYTGGAAVVAKHMKASGADVIFSTVLGNDANKDFILEDLQKCNIRYLPIIDDLRVTTNKNAFVVGDYRVLKVDSVDNRSISEKILHKLTHQISNNYADGVVFSDFRHGIFNRNTIPILTASIPSNAYRVADSQVASRWGNILEFKDFDLITPNEKEARFALADQDSVIRQLGVNLLKKAKAKTLFLKLGDRGLIGFRSSSEVDFFIDSFAFRSLDPVGAGDALLAYSTLAMINTKNEVISAILGSFAAAIECERNGNIPVSRKDLLEFIDKIEKRVHYQVEC